MDELAHTGDPLPEPASADLYARLDAIERRMERMEDALRAGPIATAGPPPPPVGPPLVMPQATMASRAVSTVNRWDNTSTEALLKWTGVGLVVAASAFLVNTAITRGWIQPVHQLLAAIGVGLALAWTAVNWHGNRPRWSQAAGIGSVLVLAVSGGAANRWLGLVDVPAALAACVAVAAFGLGLANRINRGSVALVALSQGLVVPLWLQAVERYDLVWTAVWALAAVAVALGGRLAWPIVRSATVATVGLLLPLVIADAGLEATSFPWVVQGLITALVVVAAIPVLLAKHMSSPPLTQSWERRLQPQVDHLGALALPALWWIATSALWAQDVARPLSDSWSSQANYGAVAIAMAMIALLGSQAVSRTLRTTTTTTTTATTTTTTTMALGATTLGLVGLGLILPGDSFLVVAATVAAVGLGIVGTRNNHILVMASAVGLGVGAGLTTLGALVEAMADGFVLTEAASYLIVLALTAAICLSYPNSGKRRGTDRAWAMWLAVASWVGLMMWTWAVLGQLSQGQMLVSLVYALMGTAALLVGRHLSTVADDTPSTSLPDRLLGRLPADATKVAGLGIVTLAATVIKLVTVDLAAVDTLWRSLLFFVVGFGLLRVGLSLHGPGETTSGASPTGGVQSSAGLP